MSDCIKEIMDNIRTKRRRYEKRSLANFWQKIQYDKNRYIQDAYNLCINATTLTELIQAFKVFLICCMQNKSGQGLINKNQIKTGKYAVDFLNEVFANNDPGIKNLLLNSNKNSKEISYRELAVNLVKDGEAVNIARKLIFENAPLNRPDGKEKLLTVTKFKK